MIRIALEHHGRRSANAQQPFFEPACFQVGLEVKIESLAIKPLPLDRVKPSYRYRRYMTQDGMGVNCGVDSRVSESDTLLQTNWSPRYVLPRQVSGSESRVRRDYATLSDHAFNVSDLSELSSEYKTWIKELGSRIDPSSGVDDAKEALIERLNFEEDCNVYELERRDIARGVDILARAQAAYRSSAESPAAAPYVAWIMMNETFRDAGGDKFLEWRLFQLAFIIAQIPGFASRLPAYEDDFDPQCRTRNPVRYCNILRGDGR